jgi:hypothetical protein
MHFKPEHYIGIGVKSTDLVDLFTFPGKGLSISLGYLQMLFLSVEAFG